MLRVCFGKLVTRYELQELDQSRLRMCAHSLITTVEALRCNYGDQSLVITMHLFLQCAVIVDCNRIHYCTIQPKLEIAIVYFVTS